MLHRHLMALSVGCGMATAAYAHDARCDKSIDLVQPRRGIVSDARTASTVALAYLVPVYGPSVIGHQLPLQATLSDQMWTVRGVLPPGSVGGTAMIVLCQRNGTVLRMIHSK